MKPLATFVLLGLLAGVVTAQGRDFGEGGNGPKMTITVSVKDEPIKGFPGKFARKVIGEGEAAYPDGAALQFMLRLKEDQNFIMRAQGRVTAGHWAIDSLPAFANNIYHGTYVIKIEFDPELQDGGINSKIPADKRGRNSTHCEQKIGTDEEIAAESAEVLWWYKQQLVEYRAIFDGVMKEFEAQKVEKNQAKWSKVSGEAQDKLMEMDSLMAAWRKRRMNVMFVELFDTLSGSVLTLKDYAMQAFTDQLAFVGKPPTESQVPQHIEQLKAAMEKVDKATAAAKAPEEPKK